MYPISSLSKRGLVGLEPVDFNTGPVSGLHLGKQAFYQDPISQCRVQDSRRLIPLIERFNNLRRDEVCKDFWRVCGAGGFLL